MIADSFADMRTNTGRFGDGLHCAVGAESSTESRAAMMRVAHVLQLIEARLTSG